MQNLIRYNSKFKVFAEWKLLMVKIRDSAKTPNWSLEPKPLQTLG